MKYATAQVTVRATLQLYALQKSKFVIRKSYFNQLANEPSINISNPPNHIPLQLLQIRRPFIGVMGEMRGVIAQVAHGRPSPDGTDGADQGDGPLKREHGMVMAVGQQCGGHAANADV